MKYCRFEFENQTRYGAVEERNGELWIVGFARVPEEDLAYKMEHQRDPERSFHFKPILLRDADLLTPVTPSKIVCVGRNYRDHVKEMGSDLPTEPLLFFKPVSALLAPGGVVRMPAASTRVDYEGELALVIGRRVRNLDERDWRGAVRGFTLANDVTARDLQNKDGQWTRAKGFDTFCPIGPIVSDELNLDAGVEIETRVNGEVRQHASTLDFIFPIPKLLAYITAAITLESGDLVLTGTPSGVGPLKGGDSVEITIAGLGKLANTFQPEEVVR
ncbi:MAG: fumarylacetoacetate hydrolase family protein [Terracidiphilus sp.]|jgi:2-keto-4-pentenoate hydratase/2-oxohepta-3-ene-1,7-dioic acid hydratase in catechol pathway